MGRRKDVQPLKSGQLAEKRAVGFGGQGAAIGFGASPLSAADPLAEELQQHMRRLSKKNATTKLKALADLQPLVHSGTDDAVTRCIIALPEWCRMYVKLANDNTVQVREAAHTLMGRVAAVAQSELEPHVPSVLARWWMAQYDPRLEARRAAQSTLTAAFPGRRIIKALRLCRKRVFAEFVEVFTSSPQTVVDRNAVDGIDIAKEMYERQVYCALFGLRGFIERLVEVGKLDEETQSEIDSLLGTVWKLGTSKYSQIRLGYFALVPVLCQHMLQSVERNLSRLAPTVLGAANDGASHNYAAIWSAALHLCKAIPSVWRYVEVEKLVLPRLWECLRAGGYESWAATYPAVLPLLSLLPRHLLSLQLAGDLCASLWYPVVSHTVSNGVMPHVAAAWAECAAHLISQGPLALSACRENMLSTADLDAWLALPGVPKFQGKPSTEQILALKQVKQTRTTFIKSLIDKLGGEWTATSVEKELSRLQRSNITMDCSPEAASDAEGPPATEFARVCLHEPALTQLRLATVDQTSAVEAVAKAVATRLGARPRMDATHIDTLCDAAAQLALQQAVSDRQDNSVQLCTAWFVAFVRSFVNACRDVSADAVAAVRAVQTLTSRILSCDGSLPEVAHLELLAQLAAAPLEFENLIAGESCSFIRDRLLPWLLAPNTRSAERKHIVDLLFSHLRGLQSSPDLAQREFSMWIQLACEIQNVDVLLELLQAAKQISILEQLTGSTHCLDLVGSPDIFCPRVLKEASAAELLKFGMSQTLFSAQFSIELMSWLARTLRAYSGGGTTSIENLCMVIDGALQCECQVRDAGVPAAFCAAQTHLIAQIFMMQVPMSASAPIFDCGSLQTSTECANRCAGLWNEHSGILLSVDFPRSDHAVAANYTEAAWIGLAPAVMTNIVAILQCERDDESCNAEIVLDDCIAPHCVKLASEALAMSKCVSSQCLQENLASILDWVVSYFISLPSGKTGEVSERFCRILEFTVGLVRAVEPVDLFLGEATGTRRRLLLELYAICDEESMRQLEQTTARVFNDARYFVEHELHSFWVACCGAVLPVDNIDVAPAAMHTFVIETMRTTIALSASDSSCQFDAAIEALFPYPSVSVADRSMSLAPDGKISIAEPLKHQLDAAIVTPWLSAMLAPQNADDLPEAQLTVVTALLPYLTPQRQWTVAMSCADWLLEREALDTASEQVGALVSVAGRSFFYAVLSGDSSTTTGTSRAHILLADLISATELDSALVGDEKSKALWVMGVGYLMRATLGLGDPVSEDTKWWQSCVTYATIAMTNLHSYGRRRSKLHCLGLELTSTLLEKLPRSSIAESEQESFEDLLTGIAYTQLVDTSIERPAAVWINLAAVLPRWKGPHRTIVLGYADELAMQLLHQLHEVRAEAYQLLMRLVSTALERCCEDDGSVDADADGDEGQSFVWGDGAAANRPAILPDMLWSTVQISQTAELDSEVKVSGYLMSWAVMLQTVAHAPQHLKAKLVDIIRASGSAARLLNFLLQQLPLSSRQKCHTASCASIPSLNVLHENGGNETNAAAALFGRVLQQLPAISRQWFTSLSRQQHVEVEKYASKMVTPAIVRDELSAISEAAAPVDGLEVSGSLSARQVSATYLHDDCNLGVVITLAESHPLQVVDVTMTSHLGVSEAKSRKTLLSITMLLSHKDGSVLDAILMWKQNLDKQFDGVEPCIICYSVIGHNGALPRLQCKTCHQQFHSGCLYKWFHQVTTSIDSSSIFNPFCHANVRHSTGMLYLWHFNL